MWWENWIATYKRIKWDLYLTSYPIVNSKWIKDMNIRPEIIKVLEENRDCQLLDFALGKGFYLF